MPIYPIIKTGVRPSSEGLRVGDYFKTDSKVLQLIEHDGRYGLIDAATTETVSLGVSSVNAVAIEVMKEYGRFTIIEKEYFEKFAQK